MQAATDSADDLRRLGADAAYAKLLAAGAKPHFIGYYALVMGLQGRPWNDCKEKEDLRGRFDGLKAQASSAPESRIEQILDEIGVRRR